MDDNPSDPVSDRMQALLSRAVEEQVSEQRAVSTALTELRGLVAGLGDAVRRSASEQSVDRLSDEVATVVADLRTTASLLGSRLDGLASRVQQSTSDTAVPVEAATARLTALAAEVADQRAALVDLGRAVASLSAFPAALAALQTDVAGLHDRLFSLVEVRSALDDLAAHTTTTLDGLSPRLDALQAKVEGLGAVPGPDRLRDAVVDALTGRLDALEQLMSRPVIGPAELASALAVARTSLDQALDGRSATLTAALAAADRRLSQVGERLSNVGDAAGGVPALATDLTRLAARVEELHVLSAQVTGIAGGVAALRADTGPAALALGLTGLREDVGELATKVADAAPPALEETATLVSARVADRLVETLAPRIADSVLTRVSAALVAQVSAALSPQVRQDTQEVVLAAAADSERRVLAHVDESVLALAEALLRRRRGRSGAMSSVPARERSRPDVAPAGEPPSDQRAAEVVTTDQPAVVEPAVVEQREGDAAGSPVEVSLVGVLSTDPGTDGPPPGNPGPDGAAAESAVAEPPISPTTPGGTGRAVPATRRPSVTSSLAPAALTRPPSGPPRSRTGPADGRPRPRGLLEPTPDLDDDDRDPVRDAGPSSGASSALSPRPADPASADSESRNPDSQGPETRVPETPALVVPDTVIRHSDAAEIGAPGREALDREALDREAPNREAPNREAPNREAPDAGAPKLVTPGPVAPGPVAPPTVRRDTPGHENTTQQSQVQEVTVQEVTVQGAPGQGAPERASNVQMAQVQDDATLAAGLTPGTESTPPPMSTAEPASAPTRAPNPSPAPEQTHASSPELSVTPAPEPSPPRAERAETVLPAPPVPSTARRKAWWRPGG